MTFPPGASPTVEAAPFWKELEETGTVLVQECDGCHAARLPRTVYCPHCGSDEATWKEPQVPARVITHTIVRRAPSAEWQHRVPYGVALIGFGDGCQILVETDWLPQRDDIGLPVAVVGSADQGETRLIARRLAGEGVTA